jgi:Putative Actinobacterial Holin-X, holin superfamily III
MEETAEEAEAGTVDAEPSLSELLEELARELNALALAEGRIAASRHRPALRRAGRDAAALTVALVAFATAFALANVSAVRALSSTMPAWAAPLLLAAAWIVVGVLLVLFLAARLNRATGWTERSAEEARDDARRAIGETVTRLAPVITKEIAAATVSTAVVDVGEGLIDGADEMVESLTAELPGGGVVNQIWDVALMPGRFGIRVATTVLKRGPEQ